METKVKEEVKPSRLKDKKFWIMVGTYLLAVSIGFGIGQSTATEEIAGEKVNINNITAKIEEKESTLQKLESEVNDWQSKLDEVENEYQSKKSELDEAMEVIANRNSIQSEIEKLNFEIDAKKEEISNLNNQIKEKEQELASLQGKITETGENPIDLPAGTFVVGSDLPAKRYKAVPKGSSGNFIVYSSYGDLKVNQILGTSFGVTEHVFFANDGDVIELTAPARFIPVN